MQLSNKAYDVMKWVITIVLPALATLVGALGAIYGWAHTEPTVLTITAVTAFLGSIFMVSSKSFQRTEGKWGREMVAREVRDAVIGDVIVHEDPGGITYTMEPNDDDLDKIAEKEVIAFRVRR